MKMYKRLMQLIQQTLRKLVGYKNVDDVVQGTNIYKISEDMQNAIDLWKDMYKDKSPWLNEDEGIYSLNIAGTICNNLSNMVLCEMQTSITTPGKENEEVESNILTRASYLNDIYQSHIIRLLSNQVEKAMALGGMIIKPYLSNGSVYFDFSLQGEFYPLGFNDDGDITDIAFIDQFIEDNMQYTRMERQTFNNGIIIVTNRAFKIQLDKVDDDTQEDLGIEIPLTVIQRWENIEPEVTLEGMERPLYGYYKVPMSNSVDLTSPLGASVFNKAVRMIERADRQFSRLDWEYEGGQIAIDVDPSAMRSNVGYYGTANMDNLKNRIYRQIDLGTDETYKAFTPQLRDTAYNAGLNSYLTKIEDLCGVARGTLAEVSAEARTATEIKILKQRTYITLTNNQSALEKALNDAIYAANAYITLYELAPEGEYVVNTEWNDSVLNDTDAELAQRMTLQSAKIMSKAEVRSWYTGEDIETSKAIIKQIEEEESSSLMNDLFGNGNTDNSTLENNDNSQE